MAKCLENFVPSYASLKESVRVHFTFEDNNSFSWSSLAFCSASSKFGVVTDEATGQHARLETLHSCFTPLTDPTLDAFSENSKSVFYAETIRLILAPLADHSSH